MSIKSPGIDWAIINQGLDSTPVVIGNPTTITLSLATAYQSSDPAKSAVISLNINSTASLTLGGGTANTGQVVIGPTSAVASGTGTVIGVYRNTLSGTVVVGVGMNSDSASQIQFVLPIGWYYAVRQTAGTINITSAFEQLLTL